MHLNYRTEEYKQKQRTYIKQRRAVGLGETLTREKAMWKRAQNRALKAGRLFDIEVTDIVIPEYCPLLGVKICLTNTVAGGLNDSPSLDRVDTTKGYIKGNIWVISNKANTMKNDASPEMLVKFCRHMLAKLES